MTRRNVLPIWVRCCAIFFLPFFLTPIILILGLFGMEIGFQFLGLKYEGVGAHPAAIWCTFMATLAATVSYGILWKKNWAVRLGILYGYLGMGTCLMAFFLKALSAEIYIPFEPLLLIPFLMVLHKKNQNGSLSYIAVQNRK